jgi:hypothetical protein
MSNGERLEFYRQVLGLERLEREEELIEEDRGKHRTNVGKERKKM